MNKFMQNALLSIIQKSDWFIVLFFLKYKDVNYQNSRDEIFLVLASVRIS